jgi:imidazole glycerol phosphate synthase subunit HisF
MGAAGGAAFLYSNASVTQMDEYFTLPYDSIDAEKVTIDDIVVSGDNVICRVNTIDIEKNLVYVTPLASGGAGAMEHFKDAFELGKADAALAASVFHFGEIKIDELKAYLKTQNIPVR